MRTLALALAVIITPVLQAQETQNIDLECCKPGNHHDARACKVCGDYTGKALLCYNATDPNLRFVEIIVPQKFADLANVKFKGRVMLVNGGKGTRFKLSGPVVRNPQGESSQFAPQWQTLDGSKPTEDYYVHYRIKGK
mgnify:FL=1